MQIDVKKNAKRNLIIGLLNKVILMIVPFVVRSAIKYTLNTEYLGLNSLFTSIIQVLSLSELGFSSAMIYNMYKPIAENDVPKINALLNLYRKTYRIIGAVVFFIGLSILPFIPLLIEGEYPSEINIYVIYFIQLFNTAISYFLFAYRQSLLVAYQRDDVYSLINLGVQLTLQIVQIVLLFATRNYYLFVICMPVFTVISNVWIGIITKHMFPDIKCSGQVDKTTLDKIKKLIAGTFIQKTCSITRNSLDSICISAFIGLVLNGIYNNYFFVFNGVTLILGIVSTSLAGGIGNRVVIKSPESNYEDLKILDFLYMTISGWCTTCLLCLLQPFMKIWMGEKMLLPFDAVALMCVYFYTLKMGDMRSIYSAANGLWWKMKSRSIVETAGNIILNIILGKVYGIYGIIIATIISLFICNFIWSSTILFSEYFGKSQIKSYFFYHIKYAFVSTIVCLLTFKATNMLLFENLYVELAAKLLVCVVIPAILYLVIWHRTAVFKKSLKLIK